MTFWTELIKILKKLLIFTKESIVSFFIFVAIIICAVIFHIGFDTQSDIIKLSVYISLLLFAWIIYSVLVLCSYYKLPKNRKKKEMGVLLFIDTHGKTEDYNSIKTKFGETFADLSEKIKLNVINPIVLKERKVDVLKAKVHKKEYLKKLLKKTNCTFGVFIKATEEGRNSSKYELQMDTEMTRPDLTPQLRAIFEKNYDYIFSELRFKTIDKENDLKDLQSQSTQLYCVCQLIYGVAKSYTCHYLESMDLLNELLIAISKSKDQFYEKLKLILYVEIFSNFLFITNEQYDNYIYGKAYNYELIKKATIPVNRFLNKLTNEYFIDYYLQTAIFNLLTNDIEKAKDDVNVLRKKFSNFKQKNRIWGYSDAFLLACENKPEKYMSIIKKYRALKDNIYPAKKIQDFIFRYSNDNTDNLGVKIALFSLVYYRDDLDIMIIPKTMIQEAEGELSNMNLKDVLAFIKEIKNSRGIE